MVNEEKVLIYLRLNVQIIYSVAVVKVLISKRCKTRSEGQNKLKFCMNVPGAVGFWFAENSAKFCFKCGSYNALFVFSNVRIKIIKPIWRIFLSAEIYGLNA